MILSAGLAIERLDHLARLFNHARTHASNDSLALSEILDHAQLVIDELAPSVAAARGGPDEAAVIRAARRAEQSHRVLTETELRKLEKDNIFSALERCEWRVAGAGGAADLLGLSASTLRDRMRSFDIKKPGS